MKIEKDTIVTTNIINEEIFIAFVVSSPLKIIPGEMNLFKIPLSEIEQLIKEYRERSK
jgi:predicted transcriptional regulator